MKEAPELTKAKEQWVEEYFTKHPGHSAERCNNVMRRKFNHGLQWSTVQDIKRRVLAQRVTGKAKVSKTEPVNGKHFKLVAQPVDLPTDDPAVAFKVALTQFRNQVRALPGVKLRSLTIRLDEATGRWDIEYDLASVENQVPL